MNRFFRHLFKGPSLLSRYFPKGALKRISQIIADGEERHRAELCFCVEAALPFWKLWQGQSPRERAIEMFSELRVWDTEKNNGILLYLLLADSQVEIVADRGIFERVRQEDWNTLCGSIISEFRSGKFEEGVTKGLHALTELLEKHFVKTLNDENELPNAPVVR